MTNISIADVCKEGLFPVFWLGGMREIGSLTKFYHRGSDEGRRIYWFNWGWQEPNNQNGNENCLLLKWHARDLKMVDAGCNVVACVICEFKDQ